MDKILRRNNVTEMTAYKEGNSKLHQSMNAIILDFPGDKIVCLLCENIMFLQNLLDKEAIPFKLIPDIEEQITKNITQLQILLKCYIETLQAEQVNLEYLMKHEGWA